MLENIYRAILSWGDAAPKTPRGHLVMFRAIFGCHNWETSAIST